MPCKHFTGNVIQNMLGSKIPCEMKTGQNDSFCAVLFRNILTQRKYIFSLGRNIANSSSLNLFMVNIPKYTLH